MWTAMVNRRCTGDLLYVVEQIMSTIEDFHHDREEEEEVPEDFWGYLQ